MNTEVAQMIALTSYGNLYLTNHDISLDLNHSTTDDCLTIEFVELLQNEGDQEENMVANNPMKWFEYLKSSEVQLLRFHFSPGGGNRMDANFVGGGGRWIIEADKGDVSDIWDVRWSFVSEGKGNRIWGVNYGLTSKNIILPQIVYPPVEYWHKKITDGITKINTLVKKKGLVSFVQLLEKSLVLLEHSDPIAQIKHNDLVPPDVYSTTSTQIFAACQPAWIITMPDWIDMTLENKKDDQKISKLSDELYNNLCRGIMVATNSVKLL